MLVISTERDQDHCAWVILRQTRGARDVAAHLLDASYCNHDTGRCLIDPPRWTYWVGGHYRHSLGGLLWSFGQAVCRRAGDIQEVHRHQVETRDLVERFGWSPDAT